ncbi:Endospore coat-associated protein YheD [Paenibacillus plantiphilus]|uniref:Endospore coat-associated protein YheD n=1 Tax=Paenibacillus plantiphilus TaxID=2905650 RepID=A0ABM9CNA8_9BACL|nr:YheC/YheD family protein [Paenibacillus plantiphilus]CAH1219300.1 Endospore coat-associated protein YheD [Paenibacillus plantiphilus]
MECEVQDETAIGEIQSKKPVLAILTIEDDAQLFRGNRTNFSDLILTGREHGFIVYVLTVKHLKLSGNQLNGFNYDHATESWQLQKFPFPDLIYNRIPLREDELLPGVRRKIRACLHNPRVTLFNPSFFNKWSLFKWLRQSRVTRPFIPTTRRMVSRQGLGKMMIKHNFLYLKPISGKAGKGIMTLRLQPEKQFPYKLKIQADKKSITYNCGSITKLWNRIKKESTGERYIAQQGIQLASFNERCFDLRALVQKNQRGQWDISGIGARLAGTLSITTHVPRGGSIDDPERLLVSAFGQEEARKLLVKARSTSLLIAKQIERGSGQSLVEMSMDLGVDSDGNIWFFEANAKPMKFDEPDIRKRSLERIFQYGRFVVKMKSK